MAEEIASVWTCCPHPLLYSVQVPPDYLTLESTKEGDPDKRESMEEADKRSVGGFFCVYLVYFVCTLVCMCVLVCVYARGVRLSKNVVSRLLPIIAYEIS